MGFWTKSRLIFNSFRDNAKASIRQVALQTGLSKSSVHRLGQAMARRNHHPESWFWETEEGRQWLIRLVVAVLYHFGLKRGVGAETMSAFFACLHLEQHVGCSPSTLRAVMDKLETLILETTEAWEREGIAQAQMGPIVGAVDETFLQRMMLVFMDLVSGYILLEETADDRSYETWYERVRARLEPMKTHVLYLVSDRAKALIKLAKTGLECPSIPDLFHLLHDLAKGYSLSILRQLKAARQPLSQAQERLAKCQARGPARRRSSRPRRRWRPAKPTSRTGKRFATRTGGTSRPCRCRCIPGGLTTRHPRVPKRWKRSWRPRSRRCKR